MKSAKAIDNSNNLPEHSEIIDACRSSDHYTPQEMNEMFNTLVKTAGSLDDVLQSKTLCDNFNSNYELGLFMGAVTDYCEIHQVKDRPTIPSFGDGKDNDDGRLIEGIADFVSYAKQRNVQQREERDRQNTAALKRTMDLFAHPAPARSG